ncbi:MAG: nicotinate (nicotinamide) nucleotide adenylyltransferase [Alphaproteobacteria bacterium]|nr:nicotinate (nicotinamide) nucleotide adenylyltransferase [Alphaproteobacteria bacterium]MDC3312274.1 nicotinate (nicotinamide) nucleotide adenylyltransferase [Alphaproteobacteria bacterium]
MKLGNKQSYLSRLSRHIRKHPIGLMGGSFNPAHHGHLEIAQIARKQAKLREVWWLVSPQNPLKKNTDMMSFEQRLTNAKNLASHIPWLKVLDYEYQLQKAKCYPKNRASSIITLTHLCRQFPATPFVWIMGADNLIQFSHWKNASKIAQLVDIFVMNRPEFTYHALASRSVTLLGTRGSSHLLGRVDKYTNKRNWAYSFSTRNPISATNIRETFHKNHRN